MSSSIENGEKPLFPFLNRPGFVPMVLGLIMAVGFIVRVLHPDSIYFNIHTERDVWRTIEFLEGERFPHTGSELTQGGYTFGPALYALQIPPLLVTLDPRGLLFWLAILHTAAIGLCYRIGREHFSRGVGLAMAALFATFPLCVLALRYLWNPSYIFPLSIVVWWCLMDWVVKRREARVPLMIFTLSILFQVHLSAMALFGVIAACILFLRPPLSNRTVIRSVAALLIAFMPYLVGECLTSFENTRALFVPPDTLKTANEAVLEIKGHKRIMFNHGAMQAFQAAVSPVFWDQRFLTGSFSYLELLADHGPVLLPAPVYRLLEILNKLRWGYIFLYGVAGALLLWTAFGRRLPGAPAPGDEQRRMAWLIVIAGVLLTVPFFFIGTMQTTIDGKLKGGGAIRYFFILYPLPVLAIALVARAVARAAGARLGRPAALAVAGGLAMLVVLQLATTLGFLHVASERRRAFKYSLHEAFDWSVLREASDVLVTRWGMSPDQFSHRFTTLDDTFNSARWDVPSLETGLDYAYFTHPQLDIAAPPRHPDDWFALYDAQRTPKLPVDPALIIEQVDCGGLILLRLREGKFNSISPMQNTWEVIRRPRRLQP